MSSDTGFILSIIMYRECIKNYQELQHLQFLIILNIIVIMKKVRVLPIIVRRYFNDEV